MHPWERRLDETNTSGAEIPAATRSETQQLVDRCLKSIRNQFEPRTWQAFWKTVVLGIETKVVAQELELTENSVRQYKSRVLRRLRMELGDQEF